jgi:predicted AAA+ superfamily ATPase
LILEKEGQPTAIEIKSSKKLEDSMLRGLKYWQKLQPQSQMILLHGGERNEILNEKISILPFTEVSNL